MNLVLLIIAIVLFVLAAIPVTFGGLLLGWLGLAFFAGSFVVGQLP